VSTFAFVIEIDHTPEHIQYLEDRLYEFNSAATGITDGQGLVVFVKDAQDRIVAGICGHTWASGREREIGRNKRTRLSLTC
jgi:hypothetical protein